MIDVLHAAISISGAILAAYVMQLTTHLNEREYDPVYLRWIRRLAMTLLALSMLWSLYAQETTEVWLPDFCMDSMIVIILILQAVAIHRRLLRDGDRWPFCRT
jgi:hypothetical protein